ncbi:hypothetical protein PVBG_04070 [Plasmodium vivax Brazil I]|uniref:BSD domain-containing protein n=1 Tax=Plasmodium vivax (strain Brazil I) TaxID=1033975 RepID=A0A0J9SX17_PLAV1|nr:hypothetical protein PVBG_04070 [Plasmodium vivax Brazil I]
MGQRFYLSKIVPWKKGDIMISKIYRKKYDEGFPINLPDPNLNAYVYKKILKLNINRNKILHTNILQNYKFNWNKKKEQSEKILLEDPNLEGTKKFLVPFYMCELDFWRSYFFNIDIIYNEIADDIYESRRNFPDGDGPLRFVPLPCGRRDEERQPAVALTPHAVTPNEATPAEVTTGEAHSPKELGFPKLQLPAEEAPTKWEQHGENSKSVCRKKDPNGEAIEAEVHGTSNLASFQSFNRSDWLTHLEEPTKKSDATLPRGTDGETPNCNSAPPLCSKNDGIAPQDDPFQMTRTQINGLNIYMDNDIFVNLRDKSEAFGGLLGDSKGDEEKVKREECPGGYPNLEFVGHSLEASFKGASNEREDEKEGGSTVSHSRTGDTTKVDDAAGGDNPVEGGQPINDQPDSLTISNCNIKFLDLIEEQNEEAFSLGKQDGGEVGGGVSGGVGGGVGGEAGSASRDEVERVAVEEGAPASEKWNGPGDAAEVGVHDGVGEQLEEGEGKEAGKEDDKEEDKAENNQHAEQYDDEQDNHHAERCDEADEGGEKEKEAAHANLNEAETKEELDECVLPEQEVAPADDPNVAEELPLTLQVGESNDRKGLLSDEGGDQTCLQDNLTDDPLTVPLNQCNTMNDDSRKGDEGVDPVMNITKNSNAVEDSVAGEEKANASCHRGEEPLHGDAEEGEMPCQENCTEGGTTEEIGDWKKEGTVEQINGLVNGVAEGTAQQMNGLTKEGTSEQISRLTNGLSREGTAEQINDWTAEWTSEWTAEWSADWANTSMPPTPSHTTAKQSSQIEKQNGITVEVESHGESPKSEKGDSKKTRKECDLNLDELNFTDVLEFDIDSNKFNAEELEEFEKDLLNA